MMRSTRPTLGYLHTCIYTHTEDAKVDDLKAGYDALDKTDAEWNEHKNDLGNLDRNLASEEDNLGQLEKQDKELG